MYSILGAPWRETERSSGFSSSTKCSSHWSGSSHDVKVSKGMSSCWARSVSLACTGDQHWAVLPLQTRPRAAPEQCEIWGYKGEMALVGLWLRLSKVYTELLGTVQKWALEKCWRAESVGSRAHSHPCPCQHRHLPAPWTHPFDKDLPVTEKCYTLYNRLVNISAQMKACETKKLFIWHKYLLFF